MLRARLARRPLGTGGAAVKNGFSFAGPAAHTFWVGFVLTAIPVAVVASIVSPGGPEWGVPVFLTLEATVFAAIFGVFPGL